MRVWPSKSIKKNEHKKAFSSELAVWHMLKDTLIKRFALSNNFTHVCDCLAWWLTSIKRKLRLLQEKQELWVLFFVVRVKLFIDRGIHIYHRQCITSPYVVSRAMFKCPHILGKMNSSKIKLSAFYIIRQHIFLHSRWRCNHGDVINISLILLLVMNRINSVKKSLTCVSGSAHWRFYVKSLRIKSRQNAFLGLVI